MKQAYATKGYSLTAWQPLSTWLYGHPTCTALRLRRLNEFNKSDDDFHEVVALCLWRLATGANHPWGVGALQSRGYSGIPVTKKVSCQNTHVVVIVVDCYLIFFSLELG